MIWTAEATARLHELFRDGYNDLRIGAKLGCTRGAVAKQRHKIGLTQRRGGPEVPPPPTDPVASGPDIDAMFRAAERPSKANSTYRRQPPPTLLSRGEAMS